ncbi:MAG TPA: NAD(P)H-dependent oxidoreductase subunit E [Longimicrobiales bacterium]
MSTADQEMEGGGSRRRGRGAGGVRMRPVPKGRQVDAAALADVESVTADLARRPDLLIEHLHRIQDRFGHVSVAHMAALAQILDLAQTEVYEVATFYHHFDVVRPGSAPPPPLTIRVCESISCHLAGANRLLAELADRHTNVRVIAAPCVGRCEHAPVAVVGRNPVHAATVASVEEAVLADQVEPPPAEYEAYDAYRWAGGYTVLTDCVEDRRDVDDIIAAVEAATLRGLGGAGFPTARKWKFVRSERKPRVLAINADEGEPGTFKDRYCLERDPHRVIEGALIAAWIVEADDVFIYLRDEYAGIREILTREIAALEADPPCRLPRIHLRRGAGAYICGEETALIESIEGKRGEPRLRPPFPANAGVFGLPTLVQNVETAYWLRSILEDRLNRFGHEGRNGRTGQRLFSVSGRVQNPGVYAAPNGITVRQLVDEFAGGMLPGHELYAYLPGGASGGILPASLADIPLDFEILAQYGCFIGSAAIVILSQHDSARDAAHNLMHFFAHESCGKCTPCRSGTAKSVELMRTNRWNLPLLNDLAQVMTDASICGLGQAAPNPMKSVVRFFPHELEGIESHNSGGLQP